MEGCLVTKHRLLFQVEKLDNAIILERLYEPNLQTKRKGIESEMG